jgi:AcrR family transcriptional regulator
LRSVTRRRSTHHAVQAEATEACLLSAVKQLLETGEPFTAISVQRILDEAGVSRATLYAHFRGNRTFWCVYRPNCGSRC